VTGPIRDRNGIYHYRRRIPEDVRRALRQLDAAAGPGSPRQDKREEKKRLGKDQVKAQVAWRAHHQAVEARWAQLRRGVADQLTLVQREALAGDIYRRWLAAYPAEHFHTGVSATAALGMMREIDGEQPRWITKVQDDEATLESLHGHHVDAVLAARGVIVCPYTRWHLILAAQRAAKHGCEAAIRRFNGDLRPDPEARRYPDWPDPQTTTLAGLHTSWAESKPDVKAETKSDFKASIDKLVAFVGRDDVPSLSAKQIAGWLDHLKSLGLSEVRIRDGYRLQDRRDRGGAGGDEVGGGGLAGLLVAIGGAQEGDRAGRDLVAQARRVALFVGRRRHRGPLGLGALLDLHGKVRINQALGDLNADGGALDVLLGRLFERQEVVESNVCVVERVAVFAFRIGEKCLHLQDGVAEGDIGIARLQRPQRPHRDVALLLEPRLHVVEIGFCEFARLRRVAGRLRKRRFAGLLDRKPAGLFVSATRIHKNVVALAIIEFASFSTMRFSDGMSCVPMAILNPRERACAIMTAMPSTV
jgi:hypothetical protein